MTRLATILVCLLLAGPSATFELVLPVACTPGEDCYIQNLFDHDPGPGARDAACGTLAYDGHDGTDFALSTLADQVRGVEVRAAAAGLVAGVRDGMEDVLQGTPGAPDVAERECGNGVLISHEDGWETQYCHMTRGSIAVDEGQEVAAGALLGRIGLSGSTEFPHLELVVRRNGTAVDPFAPDTANMCGELPSDDLWAEPLAIPRGGLTDVGFSTAVPDYGAIRAGAADVPPSPAEPLVLFGLIFGSREGDEVRLTIDGPAGEEVFAHAERLERTQALLFRAAGRPPPEEGWPAGTYEGRVALLRDGAEIDSLSATAEMRGR